MTEFVRVLRYAAPVLVFLLLGLFSVRVNLKKTVRSRQFLMPVAALILCAAAFIVISRLYNSIRIRVEPLIALVTRLVPAISKLNIPFYVFVIANILLLAAYLIVKRILISIMKGIFKTGNGLYEGVVGPFYEHDETDGNWYVRNERSQLRGLFRTLFYAALLICCAVMVLAALLYAQGGMNSIFFPVYGLILVGELFFFLDGSTKKEEKSQVTAEEDEAVKLVNYAAMRQVLKKVFPDKLSADSTRANESRESEPVEQLLDRICASDDPAVENYGLFMRGVYEREHGLDVNYLYSGLELLTGSSVLFNDPFYYDYIPYIFYPMNRALLQNKKVLIILGRTGTEEDIRAWIREGLVSVNSTPDLWKTEVLTENMGELPDVGIMTRSSVHDQNLHEKCTPFFEQTALAVIIEPSKLLVTAQIGLNGVAKRMRRREGAPVVWCGIDKNCDGLVDALSHALMTNITEVTATEKCSGISSYMLWDVDRERMQHRLLPNISRYLGFGTELSFAALKNQIETAAWYGGEAFPVADMHWIAKQYYYDLLNYAELPATQQTMDERFITSHDLWNAPVSKNAYLTVEDEDHNMFEMRRVFSTRTTSQGFVNILSDEYLLKDYMAENADIFEADPKAIPAIVADYVRSDRNLALRLILMMSGGSVRREDLIQELALAGVDTDDPVTAFWSLLCRCMNPVGSPVTGELTLTDARGAERTFTSDVIRFREKYDVDCGRVLTLYYIDDESFIRIFSSELQNADCITEDEKGEVHFLGTELRGHIFQKYLPGQFFTMEGKYYEMLSVTPRGQMLVRRAADHIDGRVSYRQVRRYHISGMQDSSRMGEVRDVGGMKVTRAYADVSVETPAYWQMDRHNDFAHAKKVLINGIPVRTYNNKQVLRLQLPGEGLTAETLYTVTVLFNEVFRTIFANNEPYITAVMPGSEKLSEDQPLTCTLTGDMDLGENAIYLIEDSQLDLGLLVSAERCLRRIFEIICDYLDWHVDAVGRSMNPPPEPETPDYRVQNPEQAAEPEKKKGLFGHIAGFFRRLWEAVKRFLKKLFGKKKEAEPEPEETSSPQQPDDETQAGLPASPDGPCPEAGEAEEPGHGPEPPKEPDETEESGEAEEENAGEDPSEKRVEEGAGGDDSEQEEFHPLMSVTTGGGTVLMAEEGAVPAEMTVEYEDAQAVTVGAVPERKKYHERYYLLFGYEKLPAAVVPEQTLDYLQGLGYGNGALKQARTDKDLAELIRRGMTSGSGHLCDFCGRPLSGIQHEVLADGRERCSVCSHSAVRSAEEFRKILAASLRNMHSFFGVQIDKPVHIQMVNARKLHRKLGKTFIPTGKHDGRILGVAIRDRDGYSVLVENGAPRIQANMTLVHELTHIWQYLNWDAQEILRLYGKDQELEVYEGMAKWVEIQYAYLIGESDAGKREEISSLLRDDEYGRGFVKYAKKYPLRRDYQSLVHTPFEDVKQPL